MSTVTRFEDLECWKSARELVKTVYGYVGSEKFSRDYGLRNQICRASVSIMSNIAEGLESQTQSKFIDYLGNAKASAGEVRSQLYVALDLGYMSQDQLSSCIELVERCSKQVFRLISYLKTIPNSYRVREDRSEYDLDIGRQP